MCARRKRRAIGSRAAFKLIEIDDKYHLLKPGRRVVDLGAAPGGWSQVAAERVKATEGEGRVIAIDMHGMDPLPGVTILTEDFLDDDAPARAHRGPGRREGRCRAFRHGGACDRPPPDRSPQDHGACAKPPSILRSDVLKPGGTFLAKVLRGGTEGEMLEIG